MKLIAKRNFRNPPGQPIKLENPEHPNHVHMGAVFTLGGDKPREALSREEKTLVNQLAIADCISDATDPKIVAAIEKAVIAAKALEARQLAGIQTSPAFVAPRDAASRHALGMR